MFHPTRHLKSAELLINMALSLYPWSNKHSDLKNFLKLLISLSLMFAVAQLCIWLFPDKIERVDNIFLAYVRNPRTVLGKARGNQVSSFLSKTTFFPFCIVWWEGRSILHPMVLIAHCIDGSGNHENWLRRKHGLSHVDLRTSRYSNSVVLVSRL